MAGVKAPSHAPNFSREIELMGMDLSNVIGIDEAGRGPLAGPVVAAAVRLNPDRIPEGLNNSKKLSHSKREILFQKITAYADISICAASAKRIDEINIRQATLWAMSGAVRALTKKVDYALIDGRDVPNTLICDGEALVKGDSRSLSIAAASIIAKVYRDHLMIRLAKSCPGYGFENHMGYGTKQHLKALKDLGPSPFHRCSFAPVRTLLMN